jgi:hypothetical protein
LLLLRPEGLLSRQGVLLPSINELRAITPPRLLEQPVTDPFALGPGRRQVRHESSHLQGELRLALSSKIISDPVPAAYDVKARLK